MGLLLRKYLLAYSIVNASNHTKCVSLRNLQCMTQATLINLHPNQYTQGLSYYPLAVNLDVQEVVTLLIIYLTEYVFQTKQKI